MNIVTWNMQGSNASTENKWNLCVKPMFLTESSGGVEADLCCLQECGAVPESAELVNPQPAGLGAGISLYIWGTARAHLYILFYPADPNGNRCNLAIVSKNEPTEAEIVFPAAGFPWRPALVGLWGTTYVATLHANSQTGGADAVGLVTAVSVLAAAAALAAGAPRPWYALGDFNREPNTVVLGVIGVVCPPNHYTYSTSQPTSKYDYAAITGAVAVTGAVLGVVYSDHFPVLFKLP